MKKVDKKFTDFMESMGVEFVDATPKKSKKNKADDIKPKRDIMYKLVKIVMPHCPVCKEMLVGNNSTMSPYECDCGVWKNSFDDPFSYTVTPKNNG